MIIHSVTLQFEVHCGNKHIAITARRAPNCTHVQVQNDMKQVEELLEKQ
jgi:hypothetical protein